MALKIVVFALVVGICKVQSQCIGCLPNQQSSLPNNQQSCGCGQQSQTIQLQPINSNKVLKACPQLQIVPGKNCNLQAIPLSQVSQLLSQGSNLQQPQTGCGCTTPKQCIQVSSIPKVTPPPVQCAQPTPPCACSPTVITAPVSTITIPPSNCATIIDNSLSNTLANTLQLLIASYFCNSAVSNNIINQDCLPVPVVETCVPGCDLSNFIKFLNANQIGSCQTVPTCGCSSCEPSCYDWEVLLERLCCDQCGQTPTIDYSAVLNYLNCQKGCETVAIEPVSCNCDCCPFIDFLKQQGLTVCPAQSCCQCDTNSCILEALAAYLGANQSDVCCNTCPNVADLVFPPEIPAQLICNYGYMPTTVPVVSFTVQPIGDCSSNIVCGTC